MEVNALLEDGPMAGDVNVRVSSLPDGGWPGLMVWRDGHRDIDRHLYEHYRDKVAISSAGGAPIYNYVRTLEQGEQDPTI